MGTSLGGGRTEQSWPSSERAAERALARGYTDPSVSLQLNKQAWWFMVCPVLEPAGPRASCGVLWHIGTSGSVWVWIREAGLGGGGGGSTELLPWGHLSKGLWLETQLVQWM